MNDEKQKKLEEQKAKVRDEVMKKNAEMIK